MPEETKPNASQNPPAANGNGSTAANGDNASKESGTFAIKTPTDQPKVSILQSLLSESTPQGSGTSKPMPSLTSLLGPKPTFSQTAFDEIEKRRLRFMKAVFRFSVLIGLGVFGFFYTQLDPNFTWLADTLGSNVTQRFETSNTELKKIKTDLNIINFRTAKYWLDEINSQIDPFMAQAEIAKSQYSTQSARQNAESELQILGTSIKKALGEVQRILNQPLGVDTYSVTPITLAERESEFENLLKDALGKQKDALTGDVKLNKDEIRIFDNVIKFVENKKFKDFIRSQDLAKIAEADFASLLTKIREQATDEISSINKIRKARLDWAQMIQDIHGVTRKADFYYGQGLFKTVGGFSFNSYIFNSKEGKVTVGGSTKTSDSKTFSFIAKLVDNIEKSPKFKNIDFRSFTKSRDETGDFSSVMSFNFEIQTGEDSRDDIPLSN